jgi:hypothetical protein
VEYTSEAKQINTLVYSLIISLALLLIAVSSRADDWEHRLGQGVPFAAGIGAEVTYGNYGSGADATVVTIPVILAVNPLDSLDMTFELPLVYLSSRSSDAVVVTQSGGAGRRRGATNATTSSALTTTSATMVSEAGLGDISLTAGWTVVQDSELIPKIRPTLYLKAPSGDKDHGLGTGTFEIGPGLSFSKWLGDFQLFAEGAYIFQDSVSSYLGKDYISYSAGGGLQATDRLFVSLYAKGSTTRTSGGTAPFEGRVRLNFLQSRRMSWEVYALAGFTDASPTAGGGMLVMYQF